MTLMELFIKIDEWGDKKWWRRPLVGGLIGLYASLVVVSCFN